MEYLAKDKNPAELQQYLSVINAIDDADMLLFVDESGGTFSPCD